MPGTLSLLRTGVNRLATSGFLVASSAAPHQQKRTIVNKTLLKLPEDYPEPWPYKEKGFNAVHALSDRTKPRFHNNSKIIVVEGNHKAGIEKVAKELADTLGFHYMPSFKMDDILVDRYGNDLRKYYHLLPKCYRIPDLKLFCKDPRSDLTARMKDRIQVSRFEQWLNAVAHVVNTGQGVVLEHSFYSDFVFTNALRAKDYIGPEYFKHYYYLRKRAVPNLHFWPHAVVYLDAPVDKCLENIKKDGDVDEIAVFDAKFLSTIKESYKDALREYERHSKIFSYDWSKPGDTDTIVEDLERTEFDFFEWHSGEVFEEWFTIIDEVGWTGWRQYVTDKSLALARTFGGVRNHEVSELYINPRDEGHLVNVIKNEILHSRFGYGYNKNLGDDPLAGADMYILSQQLPEPWHEYFYREQWLHNMIPHEAWMDPDGTNGYNPDYLHAHH